MFDITADGALMPGDPIKIAENDIKRMIAIANDDNDPAVVAMASWDARVYVARVDGTNSESH